MDSVGVDEPPASTKPAAGRTLGRNVAATLGAQLLSWSGAILVAVVLTRYLGPEGTGLHRTALSIFLVADAFARWGTDRSVPLRVARSEDVATVVASTAWLRAMNWVVAGAVIAGFFLIFDVNPTLVTLCAIVGVAAALMSIGATGVFALQGLENFTAPARVTAIMTVVTPVAIGAGILADVGLYGIALIIAVAGVVGGAMQVVFLNRYADLRWRTSVGEIMTTARLGTPHLLGGLALALYREADVAVMAILLDEEQVGWYAAADRLFGNALVVPTIVMTTMLPVLTRTHAAAPVEAQTLAERTFRTLMLFGLPAGIGLFLISDRVAVLLFGEDFTETGPVLGALGLVMGMVSITILLGRYAMATGKQNSYYLLMLAAAIATVPLDLVFVPFADDRFGNGALGGAMSFAVTETVILVVGTSMLIPSVFSRVTLVRFVKTALATAVMALVVFPVRDYFPLVPMAVGAVAFLSATLLLRTPEDHEYGAMAKLARRIPVVGERVATDLEMWASRGA